MAEDKDEKDLDDSDSEVYRIIRDTTSPLWEDLSSRMHPDLKDKNSSIMIAKLTLLGYEFALLPTDKAILVVVDSINGMHEYLLNYIIKSFGIEEINDESIQIIEDRFVYYSVRLTKKDGSELGIEEVAKMSNILSLDFIKAIDAANAGLTVDEYERQLDERVRNIENSLSNEDES